MRKWIREWRMTDAVLRRAMLAALLLTAPAPLAAQDLARRIDAVLDAPPFASTLWGVVLLDENGRQLYGRNATRMFIPASNTKLVVTAVAAALLPPDFTVQTSLYGTGPIVDGVLQGDLVLYGRGDPAFSVRCYAVDTMRQGACDSDPAEALRDLVEALRAHGVQSVAGAVVGDGSWFEPTTLHYGWDLYDTNWWYAAPVTGLALNDNSVDIRWRPGRTVGAPAVISLWPEYHGLEFQNRSRTVGPGGRTNLGDRVWRDGTSDRVWADGTVAIDSRGGTDYFAMPDPNLYAARALRWLLAEAGISVQGPTRSTTDSMAYRAARLGTPLAEATSRPLKDWIFPILNTSQNLFAEMLLKQLGRQFEGEGSWEAGLRVERRFLIDSVGVDSTQIALSDGSGLAADNLVSPMAFAQLLRFIRSHPRYATFADGMPLAGERGSLRNRFGRTPLAGRVRAKTGSISRVNTLSGYIEREDGRYWTFSVQANHHGQRGAAAIARIDSAVVAMGAAASR